MKKYLHNFKIIFAFIIVIMLVYLIIIQDNKVSFSEKYIMEGTRYQSSIYYINNNSKIKVLIIGGIHGNEIAGIEATEKIVENKPNWANLIVIPRANTEAIKFKKRNPYYMSDLNRTFPGRKGGTDTEILAYEIFNLIEKEKPQIVIELHEWEKGYDEDIKYLTNGLILDSYESKLWNIIEKVYNYYRTQDYDIKIMLDISPLEGSLNKEVSERLDIPVLTIESNMKDDIDNRINFHLYVIENVIKRFEMDD